MELIGTTEMDSLYLKAQVYRGSNDAHIKVWQRLYGRNVYQWFWRHPGGKAHGPFLDTDGTGKMKALLAAAHNWGLSGMNMDWTPCPEQEKLFR